ncbi:hypothetical protein RB653_007068 [Dictyostelium firmibasis]|uniref:SD-repeat containing protein B domain-containing protein n=1 Tax=Dictyostelium firmibasis TaxID=79012 RepID=A0AAN7TV27_9MYCE
MPISRTLQWNGTDITMNITSSGGQKSPTQILGINIPTNTSSFNNADLLSFFSNKTYASFLSHFNCRLNAPTCEEIKFSEVINDICLIMASVDGYDRVSLYGRDTTSGYAQTAFSSFNQIKPLSWRVVKNGTFNANANASECSPIMMTERQDYFSLGCFNRVCENPNFVVLKPNISINYVKICYDSYSASEFIMYSFARCSNPSLEITRPPLSIDFSISGYAFQDDQPDGIYDPSVDTPIIGVIVELVTSGGSPVRNKFGLVVPAVTNVRGYYIFGDIARGAYKLKFNFPPQYVATTKIRNPDDYTTSKINPNFFTDVYILSNTAAGVRMTTNQDDGVTTDRILPGVNAGVVIGDVL